MTPGRALAGMDEGVAEAHRAYSTAAHHRQRLERRAGALAQAHPSVVEERMRDDMALLGGPHAGNLGTKQIKQLAGRIARAAAQLEAVDQLPAAREAEQRATTKLARARKTAPQVGAR